MTRHGSKIFLITACIAIFGLFAVTPVLAGDTYKVLHRFNGADGEMPQSSLVLDALGNLYGTTAFGGKFETGNVFQLVPDGSGGWTEHVLHNFCSAPGCADGENPSGSLIFDSAGNLYGTTSDGGSSENGGVAFRLSPGADGKWTEEVLYDFCATQNCPDGEAPVAGLIFDAAGNLYGTTTELGPHGYGTVFQLVPGSNGTWTENVLHSFCALSGCADGAWPFGDLVIDADGNLYGTTLSGGAYSNGNCSLGRCGTVFELTPTENGEWTYQVIHSFNYHDGANPTAGLIFDAHGDLYGAAGRGGPSGSGVVFELTPGAGGAWTETVLHPFFYRGGGEVSTLVFDPAGNLCGTATGGGTDDAGIVFRLSPGQNGKWTETVLHSFKHGSGYAPEAGVVLDSSGNLYGTAAYNYAGYGVVYEITP
jgi:uncharacterized repeat protein (TIGR03803 family)